MVPQAVIDALGEGNYQSPDVVGRSVTLLMADKDKHGELVYSDCGRFRDLENGENGYHAVTKRMLGVEEGGEMSETGVLRKLQEAIKKEGSEGQEGVGEVTKKEESLGVGFEQS